jgi:hypothetical protein
MNEDEINTCKMGRDYKVPYKIIVVLSFKEQLCNKCKLRQITCLLTFKNCPQADIISKQNFGQIISDQK